MQAGHHIRNYLKQIVYGGNDGIVTTFAIVAGFAGAQAEGLAQIGPLAVVLFGLANLFADAVSMGMGEFLSARSQHQIYRREQRAIRDRVRQAPEQEVGALAQRFARAGLDPEAAQQAAAALARHPPLLTQQLLVQQGCGPAPEEDHPALNGLVTFLAFVIFGLLPILPYLLGMPTGQSWQLSLLATGLALVLLGALRGWATEEHLGRALLETTGVGGLCALVAYLVGWWVAG